MLKYLNKTPFLITIFILIAVASGADLKADISHGASIHHIAKEATVIFLSVLAIGWLIMEINQQIKKVNALKTELESVSRQNNIAKDYIIEGRRRLGQVIAQQFSEWQLSNSETEVGWLLLKGLSLKEIAIVRNTLEKTVRQQASAIYRKSGVSGRHAFSAWFIEDIL